MSKAAPRNSPCPCGSGLKYKKCCLEKDRLTTEAKRVKAFFTMDDGTEVERSITALDSVPTHNANDLRPEVATEEMVALVLDEIERELVASRVGTVADLVNTVVDRMNIVPEFTYRDVAEALEADKRFTQFARQVVCLRGEDPEFPEIVTMTPVPVPQTP